MSHGPALRVGVLLAAGALGCGGRVGASVADDAAVDTTMPADTERDTRTEPDSIVPWDAIWDNGLEPCPGPNQCSNGFDDDGDGLIDWMDPECTGPYDNYERSFATGIPVDNLDPCNQDCFFDGNTGSADDGCLWTGACLSGSTDPKCPYDAAAAADPKRCPPASDRCRKFCQPLAPIGCDCAGCCEVYDLTGRSKRVRIVNTCTVADLGNPLKCPPCEPLAGCSRPCGRCDLCLGKLTVPSDCTDSDRTMCPAERCDPTNPCPCGKYCLTGCCVAAS